MADAKSRLHHILTLSLPFIVKAEETAPVADFKHMNKPNYKDTGIQLTVINLNKF